MTVEKILASHKHKIISLNDEIVGCTGCDWELPGQLDVMIAVHTTHVVQELEQHILEREAAAVKGEADRLRELHELIEVMPLNSMSSEQKRLAFSFLEVSELPGGEYDLRHVNEYATWLEYRAGQRTSDAAVSS